jgi:hypothetical protein
MDKNKICMMRIQYGLCCHKGSIVGDTGAKGGRRMNAFKLRKVNLLLWHLDNN